MLYGLIFLLLVQVNNLPVNILPVSYNSQSHGQSSYSSLDLPRDVVMSLSQGSTVKSLDFHPSQQILLLGCPLIWNSSLLLTNISLLLLLSSTYFVVSVGTNMGDVMVWELVSRERIAYRNFKVWELGACSMPLQVSTL